jgi:hypothetical protein
MPIIEDVDAPLKQFDVEIRLTRTDRDGFGHRLHFVVRFPSTGVNEAEQTAQRIAYTIVEDLPSSENGNLYGWKMAGRNTVGTIEEVME